MTESAVSGTLAALFFFDVCDEIDLDRLRGILKVPRPGREPSFRHPAPEYVQFSKPPVVEPIESFEAADGSRIGGSIAYYEYGVAGVRLQMPFAANWPKLVELVARWMNSQELDRKAEQWIESHLERAAPALVNPYRQKLSEDYYIVSVCGNGGNGGGPLTASRLIEECGAFIAQIVRGETARFSPAEQAEILEARMSYYESDLLVVGWTAAFVYDSPEGAVSTVQLLEYANTQLLEFRHYDSVLTGVLSQLYRSLDHRGGVLARWRLARAAERLNTMRLEVRELTERVDNSIKFLSDMFAARLYRMAAGKIGVPDYRRLVEQKLDSAGELYSFMMDRFYQGRAFVLELMVVIILVIELVFLFRGVT